jgi:NarL family two-component system response regulator LiaR
MAITILLVDDHAVVRRGVRSFLELQKDLEIVGEAETGEEAITLAQEKIPDVVLMDLVLPGMNGVEATRQIKRLSPRSQVIVLTSFHDDENIFPALRAGAISYVLKNIRPIELVDVIHKAAEGESVLHPQIATRVIQEVRQAQRAIPPVFNDLTERELEVLRLIAEGYTNTSIAEKLVISERTVKGYVSNILSKLHIEDRTQAAILAWKQGLMNP